MDNIVSLEEPPFPVLREKICVYLVLSECHGRGVGQVRVAYVDSEPEQLLFGSPEHALDFTGRSPLELIGVVFRLRDCLFPQAGRYSVQFWYDSQKIEERPLRLKAYTLGAEIHDQSMPIARESYPLLADFEESRGSSWRMVVWPLQQKLDHRSPGQWRLPTLADFDNAVEHQNRQLRCRLRWQSGGFRCCREG